jgi:hypothetical protein
MALTNEEYNKKLTNVINTKKKKEVMLALIGNQNTTITELEGSYLVN